MRVATQVYIGRGGNQTISSLGIIIYNPEPPIKKDTISEGFINEDHIDEKSTNQNLLLIYILVSATCPNIMGFSLLLVLIGCFLTFNSQILLVNELARHGARYPIHPYYDYKDSLGDAGQLSAVGIRQHYNLGSFLRKDYIINSPVLNQTYSASQLRVYSTNYQRTKESVMAQLSGLFPVGPAVPADIDPSMLTPPFQLSQTQSVESDPALPGFYQPVAILDGSYYLQNCESYLDWEQLMLVQQYQAYVSMNIKYLPLMEKMKYIFDLPAEELNLMAMSRLYDTLICDRFLNRKLPNELTEHDLLNLRHLTQFFFLMIHSGTYSQIIATPFMTKILQDMDNTLSPNATSSLKMNIYLGHDTNISPMLTFLNISSAQCIEDKWNNKTLTNYINCEDGADFGSNLILELHGPASEPSVKIRYNGKYVNTCGKSGSTSCPYKQWRERVVNQLVDFQKLCKVGGTLTQTQYVKH